MTKPEGPAQGQAENYCCDNGNFGEPHECQKQPGATPAPSQPAGAREFIERYCEEDGQFGWLPYYDGLVKMLSEFASQQTAAKDAENLALRREVERLHRLVKNTMDERQQVIYQSIDHEQRAEAAERERDSLRAENAALKAGKDGQQ